MSCIPALFPTTRFEDFLLFYSANPDVYAEFERRVLELHAKGHKRIGARMVWEVMRYDALLRTDSGSDPFKLNDHNTCYYARLVMLRNPELRGCIITKDARFDTDPETLLREADRIDRERTRSEP
jgi:hypothetical protein